MPHVDKSWQVGALYRLLCRGVPRETIIQAFEARKLGDGVRMTEIWMTTDKFKRLTAPPNSGEMHEGLCRFSELDIPNEA